jgi:hypothetical protein
MHLYTCIYIYTHVYTYRTNEPLIAYLGHCAPLNLKEVVGLFIAIAANEQMGRASHDTLLLEIMKYVARCEVSETNKEEIQAMRSLFDHASQAQVDCVRELVCSTFWRITPDASIADSCAFYASVLNLVANYARDAAGTAKDLILYHVIA